jgi:hypothetical protein
MRTRDLDLFAAGDHALVPRRREVCTDQLDHLRDGEPVREHQRFRAAVAAGREQFERAAAVGLGVAAFGGWAFGSGRQDYQIPAVGSACPLSGKPDIEPDIAE